MLKSAIGYGLAGYCVALLGLGLLLSHHQWPIDNNQEAPLVEEFLDPVPPDFKAISDIAARKQAFFEFLLPLVEQENRRLLKKREQLLDIKARALKGELTEGDEKQLGEWALMYEVEEGPLEQTLERLERRINTIPPAMALAQAASESAWGTSRFARQGYNYFGQWCFTPGCGMVPKRRSAGAFHEVTRFTSVRESLQAYFHNINTHSAYHGFRVLRQEKALRGEEVKAYEIAGKLVSYSERGSAYISEIRSIIRANQLESGMPEDEPSETTTVASFDEEPATPEPNSPSIR